MLLFHLFPFFNQVVYKCRAGDQHIFCILATCTGEINATMTDTTLIRGVPVQATHSVLKCLMYTVINKNLTVNGHPLSKWMPIDGCSLFFEPFKKCVSGDLLPLAFILLRPGPLTPIVKLLVGDPSGLDPRKAPFVFLAVSFESVIVCLSKRPLFQSADVTAASGKTHGADQRVKPASIFLCMLLSWPDKTVKPINAARETAMGSRSPAGPRRLGTATRISASLFRRLSAFFGSTPGQDPKAAKFAVLSPGPTGFPNRAKRSEGSDTTPVRNAPVSPCKPLCAIFL